MPGLLPSACDQPLFKLWVLGVNIRRGSEGAALPSACPEPNGAGSALLLVREGMGEPPLSSASSRGGVRVASGAEQGPCCGYLPSKGSSPALKSGREDEELFLCPLGALWGGLRASSPCPVAQPRGPAPREEGSVVWFAFGHHCSGLPTAGLRAPKHLQVLVSLLRLSGEAGGGHGTREQLPCGGRGEPGGGRVQLWGCSRNAASLCPVPAGPVRRRES